MLGLLLIYWDSSLNISLDLWSLGLSNPLCSSFRYRHRIMGNSSWFSQAFCKLYDANFQFLFRGSSHFHFAYFSFCSLKWWTSSLENGPVPTILPYVNANYYHGRHNVWNRQCTAHSTLVHQAFSGKNPAAFISFSKPFSLFMIWWNRMSILSSPTSTSIYISPRAKLAFCNHAAPKLLMVTLPWSYVNKFETTYDSIFR